MSDFKAKMHQKFLCHISFPLRLRPKPGWGSLQLSPKNPVAEFKGPTSKRRVGNGTEGKWEENER